MKTDIYTKIILTVIAINLTYFSIREVSLFKEAKANNSEFLNSNGAMDVNIVSCYPTLDVNVENTVDVNLDEINGYGTFYRDRDGAAMLVPVYDPFSH